MPRINKKYSKEVKLKAVDMYLNQNIGGNTIAKELGLSSKKRVYYWVNQYNENGETAFDKETRGKATGSKKGRPKTKFDSLEEEIKYLRMENEYLKKLNALKKK